MGDPSGNPIDAGGVHGLDDKEVEELKREFEKADTANAGAISQQQLRMIVFNRLYLERHPAILASLEASGYGSASILPAAPQSLGSARSSGELTSGAGASSLSESLPSGPLPQSQQPARDTLAQSQLGRARRKSLTLASSPSNNASPSASLASADDQARGSNWGKPEALTPTAYSWQAQFATNSNAGRKHSIMAKDSALGFLPKEYLADAETAKLVATRALSDFGSHRLLERKEDSPALTMSLDSFIMWNVSLIRSSAMVSSDPSKQLKFWKGIDETEVDDHGRDGSMGLAPPIEKKSVYKHLLAPPKKEGGGGWLRRTFAWFF